MTLTNLFSQRQC